VFLFSKIGIGEFTIYDLRLTSRFAGARLCAEHQPQHIRVLEM
jgi:hypothetical protein